MSVRLNAALTDLETGLNKWDCAGPLGIGSGILRVGACKIQLAAGLATAFSGLIGGSSGNNQKEWKNVTLKGCEQAIFGALNILRGLVAIFLAATCLNLITTLPWQLIRKEGFAPVVRYGDIAPAAS